MKFEIHSTLNGWLVVDSPIVNETATDAAWISKKSIKDKTASFNSLDKAVAHIRAKMKAMHPAKQTTAD